jgi:hypothetical protein
VSAALIKKPDIRLVNAGIERYRRLVGSATACPTGDTKKTRPPPKGGDHGEE